MWIEIGKTVRAAIGDWGTTCRLAVCVGVLTVSAVVLAAAGVL
ncbi:hypothetical protein [Nocardia macrotermitis]|uniref:Uncharacterized protein n=1 Tax=Nocardia macrotermitis TaxID=2585198 RepID=A0A7K0D481_9NOCA|nr:hypothetical protein [Nocardia macrotermitis]MQY20507.1 hypothetical protein [Nocardia macrotermitis]